MKNIKNKLIIACLIGAAATVAQAGTSRSLGGHGMVNARNSAGSRNIGGHNLGGLSHSINMRTIKEKLQKNFQQVANHIREHGGSVIVNKDKNGNMTLNVTTGKGGTFSGQAVKKDNVSGIYYDTSAHATTAKGKTYSGTGYVDQFNFYNGTYEGNTLLINHNGTITGGSRSVNVSSGKNITVDTNPNGVSHVGYNRTIEGKVNKYSTLGSITSYQDSNGVQQYTVVKGSDISIRGNTLVTNFSFGILKENGSLVITPYDKSIIYNDQPIPRPTVA